MDRAVDVSCAAAKFSINPSHMAHLSSVTLENFRTFRKRTTFDLAPLTLITGPNSSGKSSVFKALQFLRHNAALGRLHRPTFAGGGHHLGSFENARSLRSRRTSVTIGVSFDWGEWESGETDWQGHDGSQHSSEFEVGDINAEFVYGDVADVWITAGMPEEDVPKYTTPGYQLDGFHLGTGKGGEQRMLDISIETEQVTVEVEYTEEIDGRQVKMSHPYEQLQHAYTALLHGEWFFEDADAAYAALGFPASRPAEAVQAAEWLAGPIRARLDGLNVFNGAPSLDAMVRAACEAGKWSNVRAGEQEIAFPAQNPFLMHGIEALLQPYFLRWVEYFTEQITEITHTGALRGQSRRLYLDDEDDTFTRLLSVHTRPPRDDAKPWHKSKVAELPGLLKEYGIGDGLRVERVADAAYAVQVLRGDSAVHLADLGYGYTQLLPLLLYAVHIHDADLSWPTLLIEEPEANLHPNLQARLADLFARLSEALTGHVVAETHSEYLIRRLQYLVAKSVVASDRVAIYYLGSDPEADDYVRRITIDAHGQLSGEFGPGFLDEATSLMVALFKHGSSN